MTPKQIFALVITIILVLSIGGNVVQFFVWKNGDIKRDLQKAKQKIYQMENINNYEKKVKEIIEDRTGMEYKIEGANSEEDIYNLIGDIVNTNNSKL